MTPCPSCKQCISGWESKHKLFEKILGTRDTITGINGHPFATEHAKDPELP